MSNKTRYKKFIACTCHDHAISVESESCFSDEIEIKWWSSAGCGEENLGLFSRIKAAFRVLFNGPYPIHDVTLTPATVNELTVALAEATELAGRDCPVFEEEAIEKIKALQTITEKYDKRRAEIKGVEINGTYVGTDR